MRSFPLLFVPILAISSAACTAEPIGSPDGGSERPDASLPRDAGAERDARAPAADGAVGRDSGRPDDGGSPVRADAGEDAGHDASVPPVCRTRLTYGSGWIHSGDSTFDDVTGYVTWDGQCVDEGSNSYAVLS